MWFCPREGVSWHTVYGTGTGPNFVSRVYHDQTVKYLASDSSKGNKPINDRDQDNTNTRRQDWSSGAYLDVDLGSLRRRGSILVLQGKNLLCECQNQLEIGS